ncbi:hypothetical protein [Micromonospora sp. DT31]|uniref:hypothetical protein n=1 Tax=Micromonospora sp. DT31 TaxID=3393434 RepID=UPI003CF496E9
MRSRPPGPGLLAAWLLATVPAPLLFFDWSHRWEEDQPISTALWWPVLAAPVFAALAAARQPRRAGLPLAVTGSTLATAVLLGVSLAFFRWVVPLTGEARWGRALLTGLALAVGGALVGYAAGTRLPERDARPASPRGWLVGGLAVALGALLAQTAVRLGAEDSTTDQGREYGGVGPYATSAGRFTAPAAGTYAIFSGSLAEPDCQVTDGATVRSAEPVSVPPADYGTDAATLAWVATVRVPATGAWTLSCRTADPEASYVVGDVPEIRGAVRSLIHWPVGVIWLIGAAPGLLILGDTVRRRRATGFPPR